MWALINLIRRNRRLFLFVKSLRSIKQRGLKKTAKEIVSGMRGQWAPLKTYTLLSKHEKMSQLNTVFGKKITISIIVSLDNIEEQSLTEMLESVIAQTYGDWELCLADGSGVAYDAPGRVCKTYAENDRRIKYLKLDSGLGISARLNKAMEMSTGGFFALLDQGDILHPSALYEVMKVICDESADFIYSDDADFSELHNVTLRRHKPGYAIDTLCSHNYIGHFTVFARTLTEKAGTFRSKFDSSQDYDMIFRCTDIASKICHIPKLLYFCRNAGKNAASSEGEAVSAAERTIAEYLKKHEKPGRVEGKIGLPGYFRISYTLAEKPLVSIIIPSRNNARLLRSCLSSILEKTTYKNYEIIIVENNSTEDAVFALYEELKRYANIRVVQWQGTGFNFSELSNFGAQHAQGSQLVFMNNDILVITPNWIEEMLMYSQRSDVGMVGAKLYYLNGSIQHAGVILGLEETAGHIYHGVSHDTIGYMGKLQIVQNMSAVTAACMMVRRRIFDEAGRFAPEFAVSFNDIDLCLKIREAGYLIVWTPYAEAYHLESRSRGYNTVSKEKNRLAAETALFKARWGKALAAGDPYYNRNFSLDRTDCSLL